ncbi:hypothetical protein ZIOFF_057418 [Zingiber officinale]|uniref:Protein kinase domain-containing protein n=1 Tax=Zingiber officinale TaxID=94328 RepID=A0A8J5F7J1_ZINOF|nr:hypothetical protein ZIOFF_057418 [Zingiber officinale]
MVTERNRSVKSDLIHWISDAAEAMTRYSASVEEHATTVNSLVNVQCCLSFTVVGLPYSAGIRISPLAPASSPTLPTTSDKRCRKNPAKASQVLIHIGKVQFCSSLCWILGTMVVSLALIIVALMSFISFKSFKSRIPTKDPDQSPSHKFHILRNSSFCQASGSHLCCNGNVKSSAVNSGTHQIDIPKNAELADSINSKFHPSTGTAGDSFDMEKPIVFEHEEVLSCSDNFSDVNRLGHGKYGSVYYEVLRDQEVAIKRMTVMKTKEFVAEMKVLCKVHHSSLVELTGYATTNDELFLIYEHAHKGLLKNHLHDPQNKGIVSFDKVVLVHRLLKLPSKFLHMPTDITIMDINALDAARDGHIGEALHRRRPRTSARHEASSDFCLKFFCLQLSGRQTLAGNSQVFSGLVQGR